jgi:glycosyltransferase involved in cell wall biosynthesis
MRIVIDLQGAQTASRFRGIGRYTTALARGILRNCGEHEVWLVLNGALEESIAAIRADFAGLVPPGRIRVFDTPGRIAEMDTRAAPRCRAAEMIREQFIALLEPDVVLVTSLFEGYVDDAVGSVGTFIDGARTAVILYDLIPLLNPEAYLGSPSQQACYMRKIDSLRRAGRLLAISDYAREEAIGALGLAPGHVAAISTAVDESFVPAGVGETALAALRQRFALTRPFVMCAPGGCDPRKNLAGLITAWSLLPAAVRGGHQLLIASRLADHQREQLEQQARACGLAADELVLTGYVSDETLIALYGAAALFVFPSLHEGFGLPALEAMACGAPTIGSNSTSIPEVIGLPEAMFDPRQPQAIAAKIAEVLQDPALYQRLRAHGRTQAARFSWDHTARRALRALEELHAGAAPVAPRERGALMAALAGIPGLAADDATLLALATSIAALPDQAAPRQLLVDVGARAPGPAMAAALRAVLEAPAAGLQVAPVFLSDRGGVWHYRYAVGHARGADRVADLRAGDVLYCADSAQALGDGLFDHLRRIGVDVHVADDPVGLALRSLQPAHSPA